MAVKQQNHLAKYRRYAAKYIRTSIKGLSPNAIAGRFVGPRVLLVSVPKSGTHMLEGILEELPTLRNSRWRTITNEKLTNGLIAGIGKGMFANSHLYHTHDLVDTLKKNDIKTIFMIRDPRDIAVSRSKYITDIDFLHPAHNYLMGLTDDSERLMASITGYEDKIPGIETVLNGFKGWLYEKDVLKIKYEDLVGSTGGGSDEIRQKAIADITSFLEIPMDPQRIQQLETSLRNKNTSTRRKGLIGGWQEEFDQRHVHFFENSLGQLMNEFGYAD